MAQRRSQPNTFTMSFLDLVSAGFGAAFFLFLIFASLPITSSGGMLGSTEYIDVELSWQDNEQLLELIVYPPDGKEIRLGQPHIQIEPLSGQVLLGSQQTAQLINGWQAAFITGSSAYGDTSLHASNNNQHTSFLHFRVINPCPGNWRFALNVNNRRSASPYMRERNGRTEITINRMNAYTSADDISANAIYQTAVNVIDPLKNLSEWMRGNASNVYTPIIWKTPEQLVSENIVVKPSPNRIDISHCRI